MFIDVDWKTEVLKRLDVLADKLGTTGTYLWHVLVKQGIVIGAIDLFIASVFLILAILAFKVSYRGYSNFANDWDDTEFKHGSRFAVGFIAGIVASGVFLVHLTDGLQELLNPEFYALNTILEKFGK